MSDPFLIDPLTGLPAGEPERAEVSEPVGPIPEAGFEVPECDGSSKLVPDVAYPKVEVGDEVGFRKVEVGDEEPVIFKVDLLGPSEPVQFTTEPLTIDLRADEATRASTPEPPLAPEGPVEEGDIER